MLVKELKNMLKNIPDNMELVIDLFGNQHDVREVGIAKVDDEGIYNFNEKINIKDFKNDNEINFLIRG